MSSLSVIAQNIKVAFQGHTVLDDISLQLKRGEHLAILGASGSGKSILAKVLAGQLFHEGTVLINGKLPSRNNTLLVEQRNQFRNLSNLSSFYYQQRYNSTESEDAYTIFQELKELIGNNKDLQEIANNWIRYFRMEDRVNTPLIQLSNGEHKKFQLIKALLFQPELLILDQPFTGLDVTSREDLYTVIDLLAKETTIVVVTSPKEIPACITHVAQLENGKLKGFATKGDEAIYMSGNAQSISGKKLPVATEIVSFAYAVQMKNVSVSYGEKTILNGVNWTVKQGEKWLVKGANGAGKSTLLSLINGDNPKSYSSDVFIFDHKRGTGESIWEIKRKIGYLSPEISWYFDKAIPVYEAVASGFHDTMGLVHKLTHGQEQHLCEWLSYFNLIKMYDRPLSELSSGQQRIVLLARALVKNPSLLILDEPCQGFDDMQKQDFIAMIDVLCENRTLIYVSHYEEEVPSCVDKILTLNNGCAVISEPETKNTVAA